ncbi:hypothetical protein C8R44DRAFT_880450 [Mycena epipterygia]|nr:hypothetical protein C8R44DRAFT_880450 [Mycena epipterygia]
MSSAYLLVGARPKDAKPQSQSLPATEKLLVFHPGYTPSKMLMLLTAFPDSSGQYGVPFSVVSDACRILANNKDGTLRVLGTAADLRASVDGQDLLPPGSYTYHVPREARYAVCTSFGAWAPPPAVPSHWALREMGSKEPFPYSSSSSCSAVVKATDGRCAVTGATSGLKNSYLVPSAEEPWWILRGMSGLTRNAQGIHSPPNSLALRADLAGDGMGMDQGHLVFAPYARTAVCVCLGWEVADFAAEYHLRAITIPGRIHPLNVYVRFAWGIFRTAHNFLYEFSQIWDSVTVEVPTELAAIQHAIDLERKRREDDADGRDEDQDEDDSHEESDLDVDTTTERDIEAAARLDAELESRPLAPYEEAAGIYPGYSGTMRLAFTYRQEHPEVSAVRSARVARVGEDDDEQLV